MMTAPDLLYLPKIPSEPEFERSARIGIELMRFGETAAIRTTSGGYLIAIEIPSDTF